MDQLLLNNEIKDDFTVKSIMTTELEKTDEDYIEDRPLVTHGLAMRADGATVTFIFQHGKAGVLSTGLNGAQDVGELKIGFYLRKSTKPTESKIISLSDVRGSRN